MKSLTGKQIDFLEKCTVGKYGKSEWKFHSFTGLVDVYGDFDCSDNDLEDFNGIKFGVVDGNFNCSKNKLTSLVGSPKQVNGSFICAYNQLTSLEGVPQKIVKIFNCSYNQLTTLEESPPEVSQCFDPNGPGTLWISSGFICSNNKLTSLKGAPPQVGNVFDCSNNFLTSLEGSPQKVGSFYCANNKLISLEGGPKECVYDFDCSNNQLTNLKGSPEKCCFYDFSLFDCSKNQLISLEGAPESVGGFNCTKNKLTSLVGSPKKVWGTKAFDGRENKITTLEGAPKYIYGSLLLDDNIELNYQEISYLGEIGDLHIGTKLQAPSLWFRDEGISVLRLRGKRGKLTAERFEKAIESEKEREGGILKKIRKIEKEKKLLMKELKLIEGGRIKIENVFESYKKTKKKKK